MKKAEKTVIEYKNGKFPKKLASILDNADETDLKILVSLMMAADESGEVPDDFSVVEALGIDQASVNASLKFWRGAGVISSDLTGSETKKKASVRKEKTKKPILETAHKDGVVESEESVSDYRTGELAGIFEKRKVTAEFVDEAQRVFGKTFSTYDTNIVVGIVDRLGFSEPAVLTILAYAKGQGKNTLRYCEKVAISLYDEGYTSTEGVMERIAQKELLKNENEKIKKLFGIGSRALSKTEKALFEKWVCKFGYDTEIISLAYDITVDTIQKPVPKYTDSILERWNSQGLRTPEEIIKHMAEDKKPKEAIGASKSYDPDDFFEAALERSFSDLK